MLDILKGLPINTLQTLTYGGSTIEDLTVHPLELLDRVGITGLTEYEMGYLNSYFYQIYQSGEIE